ncbi:MAG: hypothetical protein PUA56_06225 [Bacillales bacterium]|nr:hypothetical protein [Bacillales bacterium]
MNNNYRILSKTKWLFEASLELFKQLSNDINSFIEKEAIVNSNQLINSRKSFNTAKQLFKESKSKLNNQYKEGYYSNENILLIKKYMSRTIFYLNDSMMFFKMLSSTIYRQELMKIILLSDKIMRNLKEIIQIIDYLVN